MMKRFGVFLFGLYCCAFSNLATAHEGPDPLMHWNFNQRSVVGGKLMARLGPDAKIVGKLASTKNGQFESIHFDGKSYLSVADKFRDLNSDLIPKKDLTVSAWFSIEKGKQWGGIASIIQDNGDHEKGWVIGYNEKNFYFGLSTKGVDDGNGKMTYLHSNSRFEPGKLYHLVATYDGTTMQLIVNGKLEGQSKEQSGEILYPAEAPFVLGAYRDSNEDHRHVGRIHELSIYNLAAKPEWAKKEFGH